MARVLKSRSLSDGREVTCGADREGNWIRIVSAGQEEIARLPKWPCLGGMELVTSPDEQAVGLFVYSGQSSTGYELLALDPLRRVGGLPEMRGEGPTPAFSPDSRWFVALVVVEPYVHDLGANYESLQDDYSDDLVIVDWAHLYALRTASSDTDRCVIRLEIPLSTDIDTVTEWYLAVDDALSSVSDDAIIVSLPWDETLSVKLPLPQAIVVR